MAANKGWKSYSHTVSVSPPKAPKFTKTKPPKLTQVKFGNTNGDGVRRSKKA
jgi:hypothetical protein